MNGWPPSSSEHSYIDEYVANFTIPSNFGNPGAILVSNKYSKEFYLVEVVLHGFNDEPLHFPANSWIHSSKDNPESRIIFRNHVNCHSVFLFNWYGCQDMITYLMYVTFFLCEDVLTITNATRHQRSAEGGLAQSSWKWERTKKAT